MMSRPKRSRAEFVKHYIEPARFRKEKSNASVIGGSKSHNVKIQNVSNTKKGNYHSIKNQKFTDSKNIQSKNSQYNVKNPVSRLTIEQLKNLSGEDINRMTRSELIKTINTAGASLNLRLKRLEEKNLTVFSDAYKRVATATGGTARFTAKGKEQNIAELRHEVAEMKHFAKMKTSMIKGARKVKDLEFIAISSQDSSMSGEKARDAIQLFWDNFERLKETFPLRDSGQILETYSKVISNGGTFADALSKVEEENEKYFEKVAEEAKYAEAEQGFFGDPFDLFT